MKHPIKRDEDSRFKGALRHYHRSGSQTNRTWDEWIDGKSARTGKPANWPKIIAIIVGIIALGAVIAGLIIELR